MVGTLASRPAAAHVARTQTTDVNRSVQRTRSSRSSDALHPNIHPTSHSRHFPSSNLSSFAEVPTSVNRPSLLEPRSASYLRDRTSLQLVQRMDALAHHISAQCEAAMQHVQQVDGSANRTDAQPHRIDTQLQQLDTQTQRLDAQPQRSDTQTHELDKRLQKVEAWIDHVTKLLAHIAAPPIGSAPAEGGAAAFATFAEAVAKLAAATNTTSSAVPASSIAAEKITTASHPQRDRGRPFRMNHDEKDGGDRSSDVRGRAGELTHSTPREQEEKQEHDQHEHDQHERDQLERKHPPQRHPEQSRTTSDDGGERRANDATATVPRDEHERTTTEADPNAEHLFDTGAAKSPETTPVSSTSSTASSSPETATSTDAQPSSSTSISEGRTCVTPEAKTDFDTALSTGTAASSSNTSTTATSGSSSVAAPTSQPISVRPSQVSAASASSDASALASAPMIMQPHKPSIPDTSPAAAAVAVAAAAVAATVKTSHPASTAMTSSPYSSMSSTAATVGFNSSGSSSFGTTATSTPYSSMSSNSGTAASCAPSHTTQLIKDFEGLSIASTALNSVISSMSSWSTNATVGSNSMSGSFGTMSSSVGGTLINTAATAVASGATNNNNATTATNNSSADSTSIASRACLVPFPASTSLSANLPSWTSPAPWNMLADIPIDPTTRDLVLSTTKPISRETWPQTFRCSRLRFRQPAPASWRCTVCGCLVAPEVRRVCAANKHIVCFECAPPASARVLKSATANVTPQRVGGGSGGGTSGASSLIGANSNAPADTSLCSLCGSELRADGVDEPVRKTERREVLDQIVLCCHHAIGCSTTHRLRDAEHSCVFAGAVRSLPTWLPQGPQFTTGVRYELLTAMSSLYDCGIDPVIDTFRTSASSRFHSLLQDRMFEATPDELSKAYVYAQHGPRWSCMIRFREIRTNNFASTKKNVAVEVAAKHAIEEMKLHPKYVGAFLVRFPDPDKDSNPNSSLLNLLRVYSRHKADTIIDRYSYLDAESLPAHTIGNTLIEAPAMGVFHGGAGASSLSSDPSDHAPDGGGGAGSSSGSSGSGIASSPSTSTTLPLPADDANPPLFLCELTVRNRIVAFGISRTRKLAREQASRHLLHRLDLARRAIIVCGLQAWKSFYVWREQLEYRSLLAQDRS